MSPPPAAGAPRLRPVPLSDLRLLAEGYLWQVEQPITGLETLTPVRGTIRARHHGQALELQGEADTIVTLCCDRCLQPFNHPLRAEVHELLDLATAPGEIPAGSGASLETLEDLIPGEDLDDRLDPRGCFDPERWLFEQLSLRLPLVNRCGAHCPGPPSWGDAPTGIDPRWTALRNLRPS